MLRKYILKNEVTIPYTDEKYKISIDGLITDVSTDTKISDSTTDEVEIFILGKHRVVKLAWLMAISFKPVFNSSSFILNWELLFIDDNPKNYHPGNLIWKPPAGGQPCLENTDFYVIPGFSYYGINTKFEMYYRLLNTILPLNERKMKLTNYIHCSIMTDSGERVTSNIHRCLCLAFIPFDNNVNEMTVNHKDGLKANNKLNNLEWMSYADNNVHARNNGLNNTRKSVLLKDHYTGEITEYISLSHLGEYLGINDGWLSDQIKRYPDKPLHFRYSARLKVDNINSIIWPNYTKEELIIKQEQAAEHKKNLGCYAKNVYTGKTFIADGKNALARLIGLTNDQTRNGLQTPYPWPSNNHVFGFIHNPREDRYFQPDELEAFKNRSGIKYPIRVTFSDGTRKVYISLKEFADYLNMRVCDTYNNHDFKIEDLF